MKKTNTLAYVRVVVGKDGEVVHICPNTLYHPDLLEQNRLQEMLLHGLIAKLDSSMQDCQVLVVFHVDEDDELHIENTMIIQHDFKTFWYHRICLEMMNSTCSLRDEIYVQEHIGQWEEAYDDVFASA